MTIIHDNILSLYVYDSVYAEHDVMYMYSTLMSPYGMKKSWHIFAKTGTKQFYCVAEKLQTVTNFLDLSNP